MFQLILGSQSPRRKEILSFFDIPFKQSISNFDENSIPFKGNPAQYVCQLSKGKADTLKTVYPNAAIIAADTIVYHGESIFGKPRDMEEAFQIISTLSGQWHSVFTGITLQKGHEQFHKSEETKVLFNSLKPDEIRSYLNRYHWEDKAAGYGVQMGGGLLIKKVEGCFYNVMGLPINALRELFQKIGIDLWQHIKGK